MQPINSLSPWHAAEASFVRSFLLQVKSASSEERSLVFVLRAVFHTVTGSSFVVSLCSYDGSWFFISESAWDRFILRVRIGMKPIHS